MTAPGTSGESSDYTELFDDVFGSAPASPTLHPPSTADYNPAEQRLRASDPSDIPRLRSIHVTNGYREGVAASKEKYIQEGFDEGYALGAEVGLLAGWCLGALEGICHALPKEAGREPFAAAGGSGEGQATRASVQSLRLQAGKELRIQSLLGGDYFGSDGIWLYDVSGSEHEGEVTFREVAKAHPVIKRWVGAITNCANTAGLHLGSVVAQVD